MNDFSNLIDQVRQLRDEERNIKLTLLSDLRAFQKPDNLSFFTLPTSDRDGLSVASTCTGLMALVDSSELKKLDPAKDASARFGTADIAGNVRSKAGKRRNEPAGVSAKIKNSKPTSAKELFQNIVQTTWSSSGLPDLNSFTTCMVIRAFGFLVAAGELTREEGLGLVHRREAETGRKNTQKKRSEEEKRSEIEIALGDNSAPSLKEIVNAVAKHVPKTFRISTYPPKATMAYWFVDGVTRANIDLEAGDWERIADWAVAEFDKQLRYVTSGNDPLMDPASLAMAACLVSCLRRAFHQSPGLSKYVEKLPSSVELKHGIQQVFEKQTDSGIWHKYFPLFHFPKSGAADYTFSFEFLEAMLIEFSDHDILEMPGILERIRRAVRWCGSNRFEFRQGHEVFSGWNAGGDVEKLAAGMPEAWATASVHMFLWELESAIAHTLDKLVLTSLNVAREVPPPSSERWDKLIDIDIFFPEEAGKGMKDVVKDSILKGASGKDKKRLRKKPLETPRSALLFGPPGTSKTTYAKAIAECLGWALLIFTPSDFLSMGLENIYQRANEIFEDLNDVSACVILFDEMDALAQSRGTTGLDVTRQLLTTSMLPKLAELHDRGRVIFLMNTNHRGELDPAITRPGRFDLLLCMGPPSWSNKLSGIARVVKEMKANRDLVAKLLTERAEAEPVQRQLDLFTVADLQNFLRHLTRKQGAATVEEALQNITKHDFEKSINEWACNYITLCEGSDLLKEYMEDRGESRLQG